MIFASIALSTLVACHVPTANDFPPPEKTQWQPLGIRTAGNRDYSIIPQAISFKTIHGDTSNSDNLWIAAAPMFELDWIAEESMYIPEGPTFDNNGNLYFSPLNPQEDVSLVSLDGNTGERRWTIPGNGINGGSGAVLILDDPDSKASAIYHATYTEVMALDTAGNVLWVTPTGLAANLEKTKNTHSFGMNYHPQTDSVVAITADGHIFAMDRMTGVSRGLLQLLPGAVTVPSDARPANWILKVGDRETDKAFGKLHNGQSIFTTLVDTILGGGANVSNFFAIDPNSGNIYIAATAPDGDDGHLDNASEFGALYRLSLSGEDNQFSLVVNGYKSFVGGTGSTPSVSADGNRIIVSDGSNNVIAFDAHLNELWRLDLGEKIVASVAISPDNREIYAVSRSNVFKILDSNDSAELIWTANLDAWSSDFEFNTLTPTITANGIVIGVGTGLSLFGQEVMLATGMGLLDRETGELRFFSPGREESVSVSSIGPFGDIYTANSPVRRALGRAFFPGQTPSLIGGISHYKAIRTDLLVRDASCAAHARLINLIPWHLNNPSAANDDHLQVNALIKQAVRSVSTAVMQNDLSATEELHLVTQLNNATETLTAGNFDAAEKALSIVCSFWD